MEEKRTLKEVFDNIEELLDQAINESFELKQELDNIHIQQMDQLEKLFKVKEGWEKNGKLTCRT